MFGFFLYKRKFAGLYVYLFSVYIKMYEEERNSKLNWECKEPGLMTEYESGGKQGKQWTQNDTIYVNGWVIEVYVLNVSVAESWQSSERKREQSAVEEAKPIHRFTELMSNESYSDNICAILYNLKCCYASYRRFWPIFPSISHIRCICFRYCVSFHLRSSFKCVSCYFRYGQVCVSVSQSINVRAHKIGSTSHKKDHIRMDPNEWHALNHCHTLRNSMLHRHQPRNRCILQILHIYECIHCHWVVAFARATDRSVINWFAMHTTHSFAHSLNRTISRWEMFVVFIFIFIFHVWCLIILNMIYIEIV